MRPKPKTGSQDDVSDAEMHVKILNSCIAPVAHLFSQLWTCGNRVNLLYVHCFQCPGTWKGEANYYSTNDLIS